MSTKMTTVRTMSIIAISHLENIDRCSENVTIELLQKIFFIECSNIYIKYSLKDNLQHFNNNEITSYRSAYEYAMCHENIQKY